MSRVYDLAVVGSGILGMASALAAARQGKRVIVIEKNARAVGASVRNFGFVTVTGAGAGVGAGAAAAGAAEATAGTGCGITGVTAVTTGGPPTSSTSTSKY